LHNRFLPERTVRDIDTRVTKVLKDLGDPEPPLPIASVRELLRLDLAYYSSSDTGVLAETVHRLKVAGQQVFQRPGLLVDAVKRLEIKALWVPDRKRILIDSELAAPKQRWGEAHEIGHSLLPWHEAVMHGDKQRTLSLDCEQQIESEANFAAGRLLFLKDVFVEHLRSSPLTFAHVRKLAKTFGNSITTTLWRSVECTEGLAFGLVTQHPRRTLSEEPLRYFVRSPRFEKEFNDTEAMQIFQVLRSFCTGSRGPIGQSEISMTDSNGDGHVFYAEVFFNTHEALTLGAYRRRRTGVAQAG